MSTYWLWNGELHETRWYQPRYDLEELGDRVRLCLTLENSPTALLELADRCDLAFMAGAGIDAPEDR